jgi:glycosyltransferase involved in cell wall biosynthesis
VALRLGEWTATHLPHETIVVSRELQRYCRRVYGRATSYIPNGVATSFTKPYKPREITRKFGLRANGYILAVSRLIPHKGIHYLIDAYQQLKTDKQLVIVGDSVYTDEYVTRLHAQAKADKRIIFAGFQNGRMLSELYANAYMFVLPSEFEGLPLVLLEAAGFGRASVASNIPANVEILRSRGHDFGLMFRNKDSRDLAKKLDLMLKRPALVKSLGQMSKELVRIKFNWRNIATDTERVYATA